jgi:hypothetical protein
MRLLSVPTSGLLKEIRGQLRNRKDSRVPYSAREHRKILPNLFSMSLSPVVIRRDKSKRY